MSTQCQSTIAQHGSNQHGNEPRSIEQHNTDQNNTEQHSIVRRSMAQCRGALQNMLHRITGPMRLSVCIPLACGVMNPV